MIVRQATGSFAVRLSLSAKCNDEDGERKGTTQSAVRSPKRKQPPHLGSISVKGRLRYQPFVYSVPEHSLWLEGPSRGRQGLQSVVRRQGEDWTLGNNRAALTAA